MPRISPKAKPFVLSIEKEQYQTQHLVFWAFWDVSSIKIVSYKYKIRISHFIETLNWNNYINSDRRCQEQTH